MTFHLLSLLVLTAAPEPDLLVERAEQLRAAFSAQPTWPEGLLSPSFKVEKHKRLFAEIFHELGAARSVALVSRRGPTSGSFELRFEKGAIMPAELTIDASAPGSIIGLWLSDAEPDLPDLAAAAEAIGKLPGKTSFAACKLGGAAPQVVAQHEADAALAIGSAFKLYIAGALARQVTAGKRAWSDVVKLDARSKSLPSGLLQAWPDQAPLTLHTAAALMLSRSDNTATDLLLHTLGRSTVEAMLAPMGNATPSRNIPLVSTAEMFRLKDVDGGKGGEAWAATAPKDRPAFLARELARWPLSKASSGGRLPRLVDSVEWFASASDLCRAMDFLRVQTEKPKAAPLRDLMSINPGPADPAWFDFTGYKGGSEPGVLNFTWLVRTKGGTWWAVAMTWNHSEPLDDGKLIGLASRTLKLLARAEPR